jgi:hypothetical protein
MAHPYKKGSPLRQDIDPLDYGRLDDAIEFEKEYKSTKAKTWSKGAKKKTTGYATKKVGTKVATRIGSKFIPVVGWGSAIYDVGKLGYHSFKEGSIKKGWKKFWE